MNSMIEWFNATSSVWANRFWIATWQAVVVIAIAWVLTTLLHRLSPRVRSWIWRLAYVKILLSLFWTTPIELALLPPVITSQKSVDDRPPASRERQRPEEQGSASRVQESESENQEPDGTDRRVARPESAKGVEALDPTSATPFAEPQDVPPITEIKSAPSEPATTPLAWQSYLVAAWLLGLFAVIAWLAIDALRAWKLLRNSQPLNDDRLEQLSREVCTRIGLRRAIRLRTSATARSPMLVRFLRPAIILPSPMVNLSSPSTGAGRGEGEEWQQNQATQSDVAQPSAVCLLPSALAHNDLALAIAHEAAHLRRHDLTWNALAAIVHVAMYFHPLIWLAHRRIRLEQEMACDEMVLQKLSAAPHEYGRMLVNVVRSIAPAAFVAMK